MFFNNEERGGNFFVEKGLLTVHGSAVALPAEVGVQVV